MPIGRYFGVPVFLAPSWFLVAGVIVLTFAPSVRASVPGVSQPVAYLVAALLAVLLYLSVLVHELSHSIVARRLGLPVHRIVLQLLGGVSMIPDAQAAGSETLIAMAGPLTSVFVAGVSAVAARRLAPHTIPQVTAQALMVVNVLVAAFNLLPGLPLDGGRIARSMVWAVSGDRNRATRLAAWSGRVVSVLVMLTAAVVGNAAATRPSSWLGRNENPTWVLLLGLVLALFLWAGATQTLVANRLSAVLPQLQVRRLVRSALPVKADLPVAEAVRRANEAGLRAVVVVDGNGRPEGLVSETAVIAVPENRRPWVEVRQLARRVEDSLVLSADFSGQELLTAMQRTPASEYLVVERSGKMLGVLVQADVVAAVQAAR